MKVFKRVIAIVLMMTIVIGVCACSSQNNEIKTLTKQFENSCNKLDLNAMLECIDPDVSGSVKKLTGLIGMFSDKDTDELLDSFADVLFSGLSENSQELLSSIKISIDNVEVEENTAVATAEISYDVSGEKNTSNASFEYICIDEKWYISDLRFE